MSHTFTPAEIENAKSVLASPADGSVANEQARCFSAQILTAFTISMLALSNKNPESMAGMHLRAEAFKLYVLFICKGSPESVNAFPPQALATVQINFPELWQDYLKK
jgi:hypothetical protein